MSHVITIQLEIKDKNALAAALERLSWPAFIEGKHKLYSGTYDGLGITLPDWNYPVVINEATGEVKYDNFGGSWGPQIELDRLAQAYAVEKASAEARNQGYTTDETTLDDGSVRLHMAIYS